MVLIDENNELKMLDQVLYEAYKAAAGGVSAVTGDPLPTWDQCSPKVRECWAAVARAAADWAAMENAPEE